MEDAETVIEGIQDDAANEAARIAAGASAVVAAEVAQVGDVLEEHAELSEERHDEILEGELWIRKQLEQLSATLQTLQMTMIAMQAAILAAITVQSTATSQSTPPEPEPIIAVVEPVASVEDPPEAKTENEKPQRRRRVI